MTYANKDSYEGEFEKGVKHGKGEYRYKNGDFYIGKYENDKKNDQNCEFKFNSGSYYQGAIQNGKYHGKGRLTSKTG